MIYTYDIYHLLGYVGESRIIMCIHLPLRNRTFLTNILESIVEDRNQRLWDDAEYHHSK